MGRCMNKIYEDERGRIIDVSDMEFHGLQIIESKKGSVRSNHFHKKGGHLLYVVSGKMEYKEQPARKIGDKYFPYSNVLKIINAGESVFTGPMIAHKTTFLEDSVLVCCSTLSRSGNGYTDDLVKCEI